MHPCDELFISWINLTIASSCLNVSQTHTGYLQWSKICLTIGTHLTVTALNNREKQTREKITQKFKKMTEKINKTVSKIIT